MAPSGGVGIASDTPAGGQVLGNCGVEQFGAAQVQGQPQSQASSPVQASAATFRRQLGKKLDMSYVAKLAA